jgi:ribose 1,5-bisphosphate isomerase
MDISTKISELIEEIRNNRTDGASELARQAADILKTAAETSRTENAAEFVLEQAEIGKRLTLTRPSMATIYNMVSRLLSVLDRKSKRMELDAVRQLVINRADKVIEESLKAVEEIARNSARLIKDGDTILTHSYSSTVVAALKKASTEYSDIRVVVTRSGPGRSGERTARELDDLNLGLTFIDDTAAGLYLSEVDRVMVGADRICSDGAVVNGAGTYMLALAAEKAGIPFYVLCETLKFDSRLKSSEVEIEEKEPEEVAGTADLPTGTRIRNPYFDITPLELITSVVTENGLFTAKKLASVWKDTLARRR